MLNQMQLANASHEAFATHVAAGDSYRKAAIKVGFAVTSAGNSGTRLMRNAAIARRVDELRSDAPPFNAGDAGDDPVHAGAKPWVKSKLIEIVQIGMNKDTRDLSNARMALDSLAKLQGFITTETRSIKEVHSFDHTSKPNHIISILKQQYGDLDPAERKQLQLDDPSIIDALVESEEL